MPDISRQRGGIIFVGHGWLGPWRGDRHTVKRAGHHSGSNAEHHETKTGPQMNRCESLKNVAESCNADWVYWVVCYLKRTHADVTPGMSHLQNVGKAICSSYEGFVPVIGESYLTHVCFINLPTMWRKLNRMRVLIKYFCWHLLFSASLSQLFRSKRQWHMTSLFKV